MTTLNNINTDPLVLSEDNGHAVSNGSAQQANGNANPQSVADHAVNAKNSLLNCKVRGRLLAFGTLYPSGLAELQLTSKTSLIARCPRKPSATLSDSLEAAQSAMAAVNNHPATQNLKDTVANGEVSLAPISQPWSAC